MKGQSFKFLVPFRVIFLFKQGVSNFPFALNPENSIVNLGYYVFKKMYRTVYFFSYLGLEHPPRDCEPLH